MAKVAERGRLPEWAPGARENISERRASGEPVAHYFSLADMSRDSFGRGGVYCVPHYGRGALGEAFGPLALDQVLYFCRIAEQKLAGHNRVVLAPAADDVADVANSAVLLGAFLMLRRHWSSIMLEQSYPDEAALGFPCSWSHDAEACPIMRVKDCWGGIETALKLGWLDTAVLDEDVGTDLVCSKYRQMALTYDAVWLAPGMLMVSADPMSTIADPNPQTCAALGDGSEPSSELLWADVDNLSVDRHSDCGEPAVEMNLVPHLPGTLPPEIMSAKAHTSLPDNPRLEHMHPKTGRHIEDESTSDLSTPTQPCILMHKEDMCDTESDNTWHWVGQRPQTGPTKESNRLRPCLATRPTAPSSCHTVCKAYETFTSDEREVRVRRNAMDFLPYLKRQGVGLVVRVNFRDETGLVEHGGSYDSATVRRAGISHFNHPMIDKGGAVPRPSAVQRFLAACEDELAQENAVLVHCKGGFGRSIMFACCLLMHEFDIPGRHLLGWVRVVRPGAITTTQQEEFLCSMRGRADLDSWLSTAAMSCCIIA